jgi:D-alanyl-D-alanine carboxypeptidase
MAIDLFGSVPGLREFVDTPEYQWVKDNAYKFGFIIRYPETGEFITGYEFEPWHIRYVGVEVAKDMKQKNTDTFEEYYAKYIHYK